VAFLAACNSTGQFNDGRDHRPPLAGCKSLKK
jgi:hypothetical protein